MCGKKLLSVDEFCEMYGVGRTRAYELINTEKVRAKKNGASTRVVAESAEAWAAALPPIKPKPRSDEGEDGED